MLSEGQDGPQWGKVPEVRASVSENSSYSQPKGLFGNTLNHKNLTGDQFEK